MIEIVFFFAALGGIGTRAQQRGLARTKYVAGAATVFGVLYLLSLAGLGFVGFVLRWLILGAIYLRIEMAHGAAKVEETWQCPDCRMFNDSGTLICLCGHRHPDAPPDVRPVHTEPPAASGAQPTEPR